MDFKTLKPETKVGGFKIRVDEYLGVDSENGIDFHSWQCTKISRDDGSELGQVKLASNIDKLGPEQLQCNEDLTLDETYNRLQKNPNPISGKRKWIVTAGTTMEMPEYGI